MKYSLIHSTVFGCAIAASVLTSTAKAGDFSDWAEMCTANPGCKQEQPLSSDTASAHFFIRKANTVVSVRCDENQGCRRVFPRGSSAPVTDLEALFAGR